MSRRFLPLALLGRSVGGPSRSRDCSDHAISSPLKVGKKLSFCLPIRECIPKIHPYAWQKMRAERSHESVRRTDGEKYVLGSRHRASRRSLYGHRLHYHAHRDRPSTVGAIAAGIARVERLVRVANTNCSQLTPPTPSAISEGTPYGSRIL